MQLVCGMPPFPYSGKHKVSVPAPHLVGFRTVPNLKGLASVDWQTFASFSRVTTFYYMVATLTISKNRVEILCSCPFKLPSTSTQPLPSQHWSLLTQLRKLGLIFLATVPLNYLERQRKRCRRSTGRYSHNNDK
jgi:hypothetical protein